ncbi:MAG: globin domain-containing protein [Nitrospira sp.]
MSSHVEAGNRSPVDPTQAERSQPFVSTRAERLLVGRSVEQLEAQLPELSRYFFASLFALSPSAQAAFKGSESFRQRKFVNLFLTFRNVKYLESLAPLLAAMGERHRDYHRHFHLFVPAMEEALCETLAVTMGDGWSLELQRAWRAVYSDVVSLMARASLPADRERRGGVRESWTGIERRAGWNPRTDEGLLEAIGGEPIVRLVHTVFYEALFADAWLGQFFLGKSRRMLIDKQTEFMVSAFGGTHEYRGTTPAVVHMHMYITEEQADLRERYLRWAILSQGVSEALADRWQAVDRLFRPAVVKRSPADCVLPCVGQLAVQAGKPPGYEEPGFLFRPAA